MKSTTIRQAQHNLSKVLRYVEAGEEIEIRRRNRPIAKIVPITPKSSTTKSDWSDAMKRLNRIYGDQGISGKPASDLISESREGR